MHIHRLQSSLNGGISLCFFADKFGFRDRVLLGDPTSFVDKYVANVWLSLPNTQLTLSTAKT